jgi:hypothetical protein
MAQTGFTPIQLYSSSTATNVPLAANLATGELAINITDGKLFYKDNSAAVQVIGWKVVPATAGGTGQTSYAVGDLLYADTTTTLAKLADVATGNALISGGVSTAPSWGKIGLTTHVSGTLPTANGGTNLTSFTANGVVYASSTSALATGTGLQFDGSNFGVGVAPATYSGSGVLGINVAQTGNGILGNSGNTWVSNNVSFNSGFKYARTSTAALYNQSGGEHFWSYAASGTAGNAITFTDYMTLSSAGNLTLSTGNVVIGTSGKGIDFSATAGTGTSELLADYEEGTWTPTDASGAGLSITNNSARYTKVGRQVSLVGSITYPVTANGSNAQIGGFPFTSGATPIPCSIGYQTVALALMSLMNGSGTAASFFTPGANVTNATMSGATVIFTATYFV